MRGASFEGFYVGDFVHESRKMYRRAWIFEAWRACFDSLENGEVEWKSPAIWPPTIARMAAFSPRTRPVFHRLRDPARIIMVKGDPASSGSLIGKGIGVMEGKIKGNGANCL